MMLQLAFYTLLTVWLVGLTMYGGARLSGQPGKVLSAVLNLFFGPGWAPAEALLGTSLGAPLGFMAGAVLSVFLNGGGEPHPALMLAGALIGGLIVGNRFADRPLLTALWRYSRRPRSNDDPRFEDER